MNVNSKCANKTNTKGGEKWTCIKLPCVHLSIPIAMPFLVYITQNGVNTQTSEIHYWNSKWIQHHVKKSDIGFIFSLLHNATKQHVSMTNPWQSLYKLPPSTSTFYKGSWIPQVWNLFLVLIFSLQAFMLVLEKRGSN